MFVLMNTTSVTLTEFHRKVKKFTNDSNTESIKKIVNTLSFLNKINVFEIIGMGEQEIRHSYFLRWLCGNNEHDLRYNIFEDFLYSIYPKDKDLKKYLRDKDKDIYIPLNESNIILNNQKIRRPDFIAIDEDRRRLFVIEVKFNAVEEENQLQDYYEYYSNHNQYSNYIKKFIYLTLDGREPDKITDSENWESVKYHNLSEVLKNVLERSYIDKSLKLAVNDYIKLLKKKYEKQEIIMELNKLCEDMWNNHRETLETLIKYRPKGMNGGLLKLLADNNYKTVHLEVRIGKTKNHPKLNFPVDLKPDGRLWFKNKSYKNIRKLYNNGIKPEYNPNPKNSGSGSHDFANWLYYLNAGKVEKKYKDAQLIYDKLDIKINKLQSEY